MRRVWGRLFLLAATVWVVGCGREGPERVSVYGTVSHQGQPVQQGFISFEPEGEGIPGGTAIKDGKYDATGAGAIAVGRYVVRISSTVDEVQIEDHGDARPPTMSMPKELLPIKYNHKSELTLEVVSGAGRMEQNFDLE